MKTAHDIIRAAGGRRAVSCAIGVVPGQVSNYASADQLPAAWFDAMERLTGETLPRRLFSFKGVQE
jgi:hypothetical protein